MISNSISSEINTHFYIYSGSPILNGITILI